MKPTPQKHLSVQKVVGKPNKKEGFNLWAGHLRAELKKTYRKLNPKVKRSYNRKSA